MRKIIPFKWRIPIDVNVCPFQPDEYICSPVFYLNEFKEPGYCLKLRLEGVDREIKGRSLVFCRIDEDGIVNAKYECDISKQNWTDMYGYRYEFPKENGFSLYDKGSIAVKLNKGESSFDLICEFMSAPKNEDEDELEDLSHSLAQALESRLFTDYNLYSSQREKREKHEVHKAILGVRCPELLRADAANFDNDGRSIAINDEALQVLLHFLYSGKLNTYNVPEELCVLVKELGLLPFYCLLSRFPGEVTAKTVIKKHLLDFSWVIDNFSALTGMRCYTVTEGDPFTWLKVILSIEKLRTKMRRELVIHRIYNDTKIFLSCKISASLTDGSIHKMGNFKHYFFSNEKDWTMPLFLKNGELREKSTEVLKSDTLKLQFEIAISNGEHSTEIVNVEFSSDSDFASKSCLYKFRNDIRSLYENSIRHDVILELPDGNVSAHKAILAARSEVFNKMYAGNYIERGMSELRIQDIKERTVRSMLSYMYSGQIETFENTDVLSLYYAVDKYGLLRLKEKCSRYLMSILNFRNIKDILMLADMHSDQDLKQFVFDFTFTNSEKAINSKLWNDFLDNHPECSFEAFRAALKFLDKRKKEKNKDLNSPMNE